MSADDPGNMILIDPKDHDEITKSHAEFYEWHKAKQQSDEDTYSVVKQMYHSCYHPTKIMFYG